MTRTTASDVFISYSRRDTDRVSALARQLEANGVSIWLDRTGIDAAVQWSREIVEAIEECTVFILMASPTAFESANVVKEVAIASEERKPILPVYLEETRPPASIRYQLAGIQHVDLHSAEPGVALEAVLQGLRRHGVAMRTVDRAAGETALAKPRTRRGVLLYKDGGVEHRLFLFAGRRLGFGKAKSAGVSTVDLTLRLLPARSSSLDPENWVRTSLLSSHHGDILYRRGQYSVEDRSTNGIFVYPESGGDLVETVGAGVVTLNGVLGAAGAGGAGSGAVRMNRMFPIRDRLRFSLGQGLLELEARVLDSTSGLSVGGLMISRSDNYREHSYLHLAGEVTLGVDDRGRIEAGGAVGTGALVGISAVDGVYRVVAKGGDLRLAGRSLAPESPVVLEDGATLEIGDRSLTYREATDGDFV